MRPSMSRPTRRAFLWLAALFVPASRALASNAQATSLDDFVELSERLTGAAKLDRDVARIYLDALLGDRNAVPVLAYLVEANNNPTPEMRALSETIVEWWYTGICTVDGKQQLATHSGALAWGALGMPAPGTCGGAFGAWARPPQSI
jgi:hypothetical protein